MLSISDSTIRSGGKQRATLVSLYFCGSYCSRISWGATQCWLVVTCWRWRLHNYKVRVVAMEFRCEKCITRFSGHKRGPKNQNYNAIPGVLGNRGIRSFISGEQGNTSLKLKGTGDQRPFWGTERRKSRFWFWGTRENPDIFRGTGTPPLGRPLYWWYISTWHSFTRTCDMGS